MYAKYAIGAVTVGVQMSENDSESGQDYETTGFGISYQVNDDLAVSYGSNDMEKVNHADPDQEASAFSLSYTMGSLGISASVFNVDNVANSSTNDRKAYQFGFICILICRDNLFRERPLQGPFFIKISDTAKTFNIQ